MIPSRPKRDFDDVASPRTSRDEAGCYMQNRPTTYPAAADGGRSRKGLQPSYSRYRGLPKNEGAERQETGLPEAATPMGGRALPPALPASGTREEEEVDIAVRDGQAALKSFKWGVVERLSA